MILEINDFMISFIETWFKKKYFFLYSTSLDIKKMYSTMDKQSSSSNNLKMTTTSSSGQQNSTE